MDRTFSPPRSPPPHRPSKLRVAGSNPSPTANPIATPSRVRKRGEQTGSDTPQTTLHIAVPGSRRLTEKKWGGGTGKGQAGTDCPVLLFTPTHAPIPQHGNPETNFFFVCRCSKSLFGCPPKASSRTTGGLAVGWCPKKARLRSPKTRLSPYPGWASFWLCWLSGRLGGSYAGNPQESRSRSALDFISASGTSAQHQASWAASRFTKYVRALWPLRWAAPDALRVST